MTGWKEGMNKVQKKSVKFCTWQKMLVCRASPRLMTRTSLQGLKLTCSLVIYRLRSFQFQGWTSMRKGGLSFFFFFSSIEKEHESWGGHTMVLSSRDKREETVCLPWIMPVDTRRVKKERRGKGGSICSPSCVNFFEYWYLWKI